MVRNNILSTVFERLTAPLIPLLGQCENQRDCPVIEDEQWIYTGLRRVLSQEPSGRGFLQQLRELGQIQMRHSNFFQTLKSKRRLSLTTELNNLLAEKMKETLPDVLAKYESLKSYEIFAGDGHYRNAGAHDRKIDDKKYAVGHFYTLNLRTHGLTHLDSSLIESGRKKEHDMHLLKRSSIKQLRQGVRKGKRVLYVWDCAGIDFLQWHKWKQGSGIYFLSREKANMKLEVIGELEWEKTDSVNTGVISDELTVTSQGVSVRRIKYRCPCSGENYQFITTVMDVEPGLLAQLYKMRWDIEKVYDELKTKLNEKKAWASGQTARNMQAELTCLMHNLMVLLESKLKEDEAITDEKENQRREKRLERAVKQAAQRGKKLSQLHQDNQRVTQRGQKFIRWLRNHQWLTTSWADALHALRYSYGINSVMPRYIVTPQRKNAKQ